MKKKVSYVVQKLLLNSEVVLTSLLFTLSLFVVDALFIFIGSIMFWEESNFYRGIMENVMKNVKNQVKSENQQRSERAYNVNLEVHGSVTSHPFMNL